MLTYVDLLKVQELNSELHGTEWQKSTEYVDEYLHQDVFRADNGEVIEDFFYDMEVIVVLTRDERGAKYLRVYSTLSAAADHKEILTVRRPADDS